MKLTQAGTRSADFEGTGMTSYIITGDCVDTMKTLEPNSFDLIFADPPYNIGIDYGKGNRTDKLWPAVYWELLDDWVDRACKLLGGKGAIWFLINEENANRVNSKMDKHCDKRSRIIWHESFSQYQDGGFTQEYRHLFYYVKDENNYWWFPDAIRIQSKRQKMGDKRANPKGRIPGNVWEVSRLCGTFNERVDWHPCQLPQKPLRRILRACLPPASEQVCNVLELFSGSGSFGVATKQEGHNYTGIEKNPEYARKAKQRIDAYAVQQELFERT